MDLPVLAVFDNDGIADALGHFGCTATAALDGKTR